MKWLALLALGGCAVVGVQPRVVGESPPKCDSSNALPAVDIAGTVVTAVVAGALLRDAECKDNPGCIVYAVPIALPVLYFVSAMSGFSRTSDCRVARRGYEKTAEEAAAKAAPDHYLGGKVSGLRGALVLSEKTWGDQVTVEHDGTFRFIDRPEGTPYEVFVSRQPDGQRCEVSGAAGVVDGDFTFITVTCSDE